MWQWPVVHLSQSESNFPPARAISQAAISWVGYSGSPDSLKQRKHHAQVVCCLHVVL
jgi:hypothetical protein